MDIERYREKEKLFTELRLKLMRGEIDYPEYRAELHRIQQEAERPRDGQ